MSSPIQVSKPSVTELFRSDQCNIGNGSIIIHLRNCDVRINPVLTIDNAAKLAAKSIYEVMQHDDPYTQEPEWLNAVTFSSEEFDTTPAIKIINDKLYVNSPPFLKSKKNILFWKRFTDYWYIMVVKAMEKALFNRKDRTSQEDKTIDTYSRVDV